MKKIAFLIVTIVSFQMYAQKGTYLVSGNIFYNNTENSDVNSVDNQNISFNPKVGYQFADNFTIGIESSIGEGSWTREIDNYESTRLSFSIGSFLRYSKTLSDSFSLFTDLGVGYQSTNDKFVSDTTPENNSRANGFYAAINPLLHLKIKNGFGLNFGLGGISYDVLEYNKANNTQTNFGVSFGQAFSLGIQKVF